MNVPHRIGIDKLREAGRAKRRDEGKRGKHRKAWRGKLRALPQMRKGPPIHPFGPERLEVAMDADDVLVRKLRDFLRGQQGDALLDLAFACLTLAMGGLGVG